jgi:hypothetical protein
MGFNKTILLPKADAMMATTIINIERGPEVISPSRCCQNYVPVFDPETSEVFCECCGIVNDLQTEVARELNDLSVMQMKDSSAVDHMISMSGALIENGSSHAMRSWANKGLAMELGPPSLSHAKDFNHKGVVQILQNPYVIGQMVDRNGFLYEKDGKPKIQITYKADKIYTDTMVHLNRLFQSRKRDDYERARAGKQVHRIFSHLVFGDLPKLIAEMADYKANMSHASDNSKDAAKVGIFEHVEYVRTTLVRMLNELDQ